MARLTIKGRTALVTGGSAGIGLEITRRLLLEGATRVLVVGRDSRRLANIEAEGSGRVLALCADLGDSSQVDHLLAEIPTLAPDLSLVFNNAGSQALTDFVRDGSRVLLPIVRAEVALNLTALVAICVGLVPHLSRQPTAVVVNVSSALALAPKMSSPVYCATKAGVAAFTRALRYQFEDALPNIRVVEAVPPLVDTAMTRGRGRAKMSPAACAAAIVDGIMAGQTEVYVGKSRFLRVLMRVSPALGRKVMRGA